MISRGVMIARRLGFVFTWVSLAAGSPLFFTSCASNPVKTTPELSALIGKKVALVSVEGDASAEKIVEVALVNQLIKRRSFFLLPKREIERIRTAYDRAPDDWYGVAREAGADYALKADVLQFDAPIHEGFTTEEVYD